MKGGGGGQVGGCWGWGVRGGPGVCERYGFIWGLGGVSGG